MLYGVAVDERLDGGAAHGIADEAYGHAERVGEQGTEVVGDGRDVRRIILGEGFPLGGHVVVEAVEVDQRGAVPRHGIGVDAGAHVVDAQVALGESLGNVLLGVGGLAQHEGHVGLARAEPYLAYEDICEREGGVAIGDGEREGLACGLTCLEGELPRAVGGCGGALLLLAQGGGNLASCIGSAT